VLYFYYILLAITAIRLNNLTEKHWYQITAASSRVEIENQPNKQTNNQ